MRSFHKNTIIKKSSLWNFQMCATQQDLLAGIAWNSDLNN